MEVSWQSLPKELLSTIFDHVKDNSDLLKLQLVCTNWSSLAYQNLYNSTILDQDTVAALVQTLKESKYEPRFYVKSIEFPAGESHSEFGGAIDYLDILVRLCPNLTSVIVDDETEELYKDLLSLHKQGYLQHIEYIPDYAYRVEVSTKNSYNSMAVCMKATLARLFIERLIDRITPQKETDINMLERLQEFSRLKELELACTADMFFYEMDALIEKCSTTLQSFRLNLANYHVALQRTRFPVFDLNKVTRRPQVKSLHVSTSELTTKDLKYIMHKFTGLTKLFAENEAFDDIEAIDKLLANDHLSSQTYLDAFEYMVSLDSFEASGLPIASSVRESLAFWAKLPQLKALTISGTRAYAREGILLTVMNTEGEGEFNETEFEHKEDGAWEMKLDLQFHDFATFCKQTLEQFSGNTIEHINLFLNLEYYQQIQPFEIERGEAIGESFSYIMDHYPAIKEIDLQDTRLLSFDANTVGKRLRKLKFSSCWIKPVALLQLSNCVSHIDNLIFFSVTMLNDTTSNDRLSIQMPRTTFEGITVWPGDAEKSLIKLQKSVNNGATQTTRYFFVSEKRYSKIHQSTYDAFFSKGKDRLCNVVDVDCQDLETLTITGEYGCSLTFDRK